MKKVFEWSGDALQARSMSVGVCKDGLTVGFDMVAADGNVFAHGHFDLDTAEEFLRMTQEAVVELREATRRG